MLILVAHLLDAETWKYLGLGNEPIAAIAIGWSNTQIVYAASVGDFSAGTVGGIFKTTNDGTTWHTLVRVNGKGVCGNEEAPNFAVTRVVAVVTFNP